MRLDVADLSTVEALVGPGTEPLSPIQKALAGQDGDAGPAPRRLRVAQAGTALPIDRNDLYDLLGQRPDLLQQIFTALFGRRRR